MDLPTIAAVVATNFATAALVYFTCASGKINKKIDLSKPKVVEMVKMADLKEKDKVVYCRCWKSKSFPLCDGAHNAHNKKTGDNVGPIVIKA
mmetsp:Transcript_18644/g.27889  ORF Transcript_18644/g.27889 Transcript_18644/m.27889 type:complete len:92 (-) Transcript_18644:140-415(-)